MSNAIVMPPAGVASWVREAYLAPYNGQTLALYARHVDDWLAWCNQQGLDPLGVSRLHIELYAKHRGEVHGNKPSTIRSIFSALRGYYRTAQVEDVITKNPVEFARRPRVTTDPSARVWFTKFELHRFLHAAREISPRHDAAAHLIAVLGLRATEACNVQIEDTRHRAGGYQSLRLVGKGGRAATIPLPVSVLRAIDRAADGRDTGPLLRNLDGRQLNRHGLAGLVVTICRRADLPVVTPHVLRRSAITGILDSGFSLRDAQHFARHAKPDTTMIYDRTESSPDRHPVHALSAFLAS